MLFLTRLRTRASVQSVRSCSMSINVNQKIGVHFAAGFNGAAIFKQLKKDGVSRVTVDNVLSRIKKDQPLDGRVKNG